MRVHRESERLNIELARQKDAFYRFVPTRFLELLDKSSVVDIDVGDNTEKVEMSSSHILI
ncbi:MAG: hypothetical protein H7A25_12310 [Leptospiraceae bacterium]|nr:hypothetical protein [Leptospiraceae bacterium]